MSSLSEDLSEALQAAGDLGVSLHQALQEAEKSAAESTRLASRLKQLEGAPVPVPITLEKVALDPRRIDATLNALSELELLTTEARQKWAFDLKQDPNSALDLAQCLATSVINLPSDPGGSVVEKTASSQSLKQPRAAVSGAGWFG